MSKKPSQARRLKRKKDRAMKKLGGELELPTEKDIEDYINNKIKQLKNETK
jgi:hypothetical protein